MTAQALPQSIADFHAQIREGRTTVTSVVERYLQRQQSTTSLNAFLSTWAEDTRAAAAAADAELHERGIETLLNEKPLWGVPVAVKDNLHVLGRVTTCGSRMLEGFCAPFDAHAVKKLVEAGAIVIGKTNLDEFAMGGSGENSAFGPTLHPTHPDRVPGGSSSGSATAVAADLALAALGSDTGGSIRLPASFCGIVGLKPTYGRVSRRGLVAYGSSLDQVGPMTRTVADAMSVFEAIHGHDARDSTSAAIPKASISRKSILSERKIRIGIPREFFVEGVMPEVRALLERKIRSLEGRGAEIVEISLPHITYGISVYYIVAMAEASSNLSRYDSVRFGVRAPLAAQASQLEEFYAEARSLFGKEVKRRILLGSFVLSAGFQDQYYRTACQVRRLIAQDFSTAFKSVDLIAGPVAPTTAFPLGMHHRDPLQMYLNDLFTIPANLAGIPALSVPVGVDSQGLPVGMQLMGAPFSEELLLRAGLDVEEQA